MPSLSVVIPAYNRAHLLPRALGSVRAQNFGDFEIVVVDDGSTDDTEQVVQGVDDERIRYVYQANAGAGAARNRGVQSARSACVVFLDSDDEAAPGWLESFWDAFDARGADVVCCGHRVVDAEGRAQDVALPRQYGPAFKSVHGLFQGSLGMRKAVFEAVGGYAERLPSGQHTDLALRLAWHPAAARWTMHSIMEPLVSVHLHDGARIRKDLTARYQGGRALLQRHADKFRRDPRVFALTCGSVGVSAFRVGERQEARRLFLQAVRADPTDWKRWARVVMAYCSPIGERVWN